MSVHSRTDRWTVGRRGPCTRWNVTQLKGKAIPPPTTTCMEPCGRCKVDQSQKDEACTVAWREVAWRESGSQGQKQIVRTGPGEGTGTARVMATQFGL